MTEQPTEGARLADLSVRLDPSVRRITVRGELDMRTVPILADAMATLIGPGAGDTTLDFSGVSFIDAAGLGCLVGFANQLAACGAAIGVTGASARLRRVFDTVQLGGLLQAAGSPGGTGQPSRTRCRRGSPRARQRKRPPFSGFISVCARV